MDEILHGDGVHGDTYLDLRGCAEGSRSHRSLSSSLLFSYLLNTTSCVCISYQGSARTNVKRSNFLRNLTFYLDDSMLHLNA